MILNLLLGFGVFIGTSIPQGTISLDTPSGLSIEYNQKFYFDYSFMFSNYRRSNYEVKMFGLGVGREFTLANRFSIFPRAGVIRIFRDRENNGESGISPILSLRLLYLFPGNGPKFQIGFKIKEIFDNEIDIDFLDIGIGFRLQ
jgi:hypothetical protein